MVLEIAFGWFDDIVLWVKVYSKASKCHGAWVLAFRCLGFGNRLYRSPCSIAGGMAGMAYGFWPLETWYIYGLLHAIE